MLFTYPFLDCQPYSGAHEWPLLHPLCALRQRCAMWLQEMGVPHQVLHARFFASAGLRILD